MTTKLDAPKIVKEIYDEASNAVRATVVNTEISMELSHSDGDTVYTYAPSSASTGTVNESSQAADVIVAAASAVGYKNALLYSHTTVAGSAMPTLTLQVSPADAGDVWVSTSHTLQPNTTATVKVASAILALNARRVRVITDGATTGAGSSVTAYLVLQG